MEDEEFPEQYHPENDINLREKKLMTIVKHFNNDDSDEIHEKGSISKERRNREE